MIRWTSFVKSFPLARISGAGTESDSDDDWVKWRNKRMKKKQHQEPLVVDSSDDDDSKKLAARRDDADNMSDWSASAKHFSDGECV